MTSPSPTSKRRRVARLIGVVVVIGVGALVVGNWSSLLVQYYTYKLSSALEAKDHKSLTPIIEGLAAQGEAALPKCISWTKGEDPLWANASRLVFSRMGDKALPSVKKLLQANEERTKLRTLDIVPDLGANTIAISGVYPSHLGSVVATKRGWQLFGVLCIPELVVLLNDPSPKVQLASAKLLDGKADISESHQRKIDAILNEAKQ